MDSMLYQPASRMKNRAQQGEDEDHQDHGLAGRGGCPFFHDIRIIHGQQDQFLNLAGNIVVFRLSQNLLLHFLTENDRRTVPWRLEQRDK